MTVLNLKINSVQKIQHWNYTKNYIKVILTKLFEPFDSLIEVW